MPLTKKQRGHLETTLYHLKRAERYIFGPQTAVAARKPMATTTLDYSRADGAVLYEVEREYGSDLVGLRDGIARLEQFLNNG
jgi:hypothetical protein